MVDNNYLPRGGFFRGIIAGLLFAFFVFVGLAAIFPISEEIAAKTPPVAKSDSAIIELPADSPESTLPIALPSEVTGTVELGDTPKPVQTEEPDVTIVETATAPVSTDMAISTLPTSAEVKITETEEVAPVVEMPTIPSFEAPAAFGAPPAVEIENSQNVDISVASVESQVSLPNVEQPLQLQNEEDVKDAPATESESLAKPVGGFEMSGQSIIAPQENDNVSEVENTLSTDALATFKQQFDDTSSKPLMSVILLAEDTSDIEVISALPFPITIALSSSSENLDNLIAAYRAKEGEVLLLNDGGEILNTINNANGVIGLIDNPDAELNKNSQLLDSIVVELSKTGHAIVAMKTLGISRVESAAKKGGVPSASVNLNLDSSAARVANIRELDKAVLKASDGGAIVVYSEATLDVLSALKFWIKSQKAQSVTLAPVSASILRNQ